MEAKNHILLSGFQYNLPEHFIAEAPTERGQSRLLVYKNGSVSHARFAEIADQLPSESLLVFNESKVIPARIFAQTPKGKTVEIFLLKPAGQFADPVLALSSYQTAVWECMVGRRKDWKEEDVLMFEQENRQINVRWENRELNQIRFSWSPENMAFAEVLEAIGKIPLPPYIQRDVVESDKHRYQTVYAKSDGSVAAPTAGLHFTDKILENIRSKGHQTGFVTLHVGAGTFMPVKTDNMMEHPMHSELMTVQRSFIEKLSKHHGPVVPVGTTSLRVLESLWHLGASTVEINQVAQFPETATATYTMQESMTRLAKRLQENKQDSITAETSIMIYPGYTLHACDALVTNFHQPGSTLLMLVSALIGEDWKKVYEEAKNENYRFLSYGDSSLLFKKG